MKLFSKQKEIAIHIIYWTIFVVGFFINMKPENEYVFGFDELSLFSVSYITINITTFYLNYFYVLPKFFDIKMLPKFFLGMLLIFTFFIATRYLVEEVLFLHFFGTGNYFEGTPLSYYIIDNFHWGSKPIFASTIMWIVINFIRTLQKETSLNEEKKKAEIQFLKSQINPHFVFNTLNNIYSLMDSGSPKSLQTLEKLSEMMRFTTYETQKEMIPIESEIAYINSFIELEKLRINPNSLLKIDFFVDDPKQEIPPYLIMPLAENMFKHGKFSAQNEAFFSVKLQSKKLKVVVKNASGKKLKDAETGIGLENLRKRLDFYFPEKYVLKIEETLETYTAKLEINL